MRASEGSFTHESILRLPYRTYCGYVRLLNIEADETELVERFRSNRAMAREYREGIDAWRLRQPPPGR